MERCEPAAETPPRVRVSVIIPIYNRGSLLRRTIDSVCEQSFPDWELLLVDDGSSDDTPQICRSYTDPRVRYLPQPNGGQAVARNHGLSLARGEYVAFLDHDDWWEPQKLRLQAEYLDAHPEAVLVYGRVRHVNEEGHDCGVVDGPKPSGSVYRELLIHHNFLYTMSLPMMRADAVREVGGFDPTTDISDDIDLFLKLALRAAFGFLPDVLLNYNIGNASQQTRNIFRVFRSERNCIQRHLRSGPRLDQQELSQIRRSWGLIFAPGFREQGWHALRRGDYRFAWRCYGQCLRLRPSLIGDGNLRKDVLQLLKRTLMGGERGSAGDR